MKTYSDFIQAKTIVAHDQGTECSPSSLNSRLFNFQRDIVSWALRKGRAAIWADCGLGSRFQKKCKVEFGVTE